MNENSTSINNANMVVTNAQNACQNNKHETWVAWIYRQTNYFRMARNIWQMGKVLSPTETVRQVVRYTIMPVANLTAKLTGYERIKTIGYVTTEVISAAFSPVQWGMQKLVGWVSKKLIAKKVINYFDIDKDNKEAKDLVRILSNEGSQFVIPLIENYKIYNYALKDFYPWIDKRIEVACKWVDKQIILPLINKTALQALKTIDTKFNGMIESCLDSMGIDKATPPFLTHSEIEEQNNLVMTQKKIQEETDAVEKINDDRQEQEKNLQSSQEQLNKMQEQKQKAKDYDPNEAIKKAREYEKTCQEKKDGGKKYMKNKKYKEVWATQIAEVMQKEFGLSNVEKGDLYSKMLKKLYGSHGEKCNNRAMQKVIEKFKNKQFKSLSEQVINQQDCVKHQEENLQNMKNCLASHQAKLKQSQQAYRDSRNKFEESANQYQKEKFFDEEKKRTLEWVKQKNKHDENRYFYGNVQIELPISKLEDEINLYLGNELKKNKLSNDAAKVNLSDEKIKISSDEEGHLNATVSLEVTPKKMGGGSKVTPFKLDLTIKLDIIEIDEFIGAQMIDVNYKLKSKPRLKVAGIKVARVRSRVKEGMDKNIPKIENRIQQEFNEFFDKNNFLAQVNEKLPEGVTLNNANMKFTTKNNNGTIIADINLYTSCSYHLNYGDLLNLLQSSITGELASGYLEVTDAKDIKYSNAQLEFSVFLKANGQEGKIQVAAIPYFNQEKGKIILENLSVLPDFNSQITNFTLEHVCEFFSGSIRNVIESLLNRKLEDQKQLEVEKVCQKSPGTVNIDLDNVKISNISFGEECVNTHIEILPNPIELHSNNDRLVSLEPSISVFEKKPVLNSNNPYLFFEEARRNSGVFLKPSSPNNEIPIVKSGSPPIM